MADKRKVSSESEKKFKEIDECLEKFHRLKTARSNDPTAPPPKSDEEIKKEIKKLHKFKETLRSLSPSYDAKAKNLIDDYRKKIEKALESFKVYEKEKEAKSKDPPPKENNHTKNKASTEKAISKSKEELALHLNTLNDQLQSYKTEHDSLMPKKGKFKQTTRQMQLTKIMDSHNTHIQKLQQITTKTYIDDHQIANSLTILTTRLKTYLNNPEEKEGVPDDDLYNELLSNEAKNEQSETAAAKPSEDILAATTETLEESMAALTLSAEEGAQKTKQGPEPQTANKESKSSSQENIPQFDEPQKEVAPSKGSAQGQFVPPNSHDIPPPNPPDEAPNPPTQSGVCKAQGSPIQPTSTQSALDPPKKSEKDGLGEKFPQGIKKTTSDAHPKMPLKPPIHDFNWYNEQLLLSYQNHPTQFDGDRLLHHTPKYPWKPSHVAFPTSPSESLYLPQGFQSLNIDTLFFIFYHQTGTYNQYLAAKELKRRNWRFHKKSFIWFQRHEEPRISTETSEQGNYIYFDHKNDWSFKLETDFIFEYAYLEDELHD